MRIHLQSMVEGTPDNMLLQAWVDHDFGFFSHAKRLYDYQHQKCAVVGLARSSTVGAGQVMPTVIN
jgi:hypothetical protein